MKGEEILQAAIGHTLRSGRLQSFYLNDELVNRVIVTFLYFDKWIRITSTDEKTTVSMVETIENVTALGDEEFRYPIEPIETFFPEFKKYMGKTLIGFKELILRSQVTLSFGVNLYFEGELNFIIHNQDYPVDRNEYCFDGRIPKDLKEK